MTRKIISLFSGYGGLEMGVQMVIPAEVIAHVEFDADPSRILAHHWPDVPNLNDVTTVDWDEFITGHPELGDMVGTYRADVIMTGGFPCQDVSLAGLRRGLQDGTRSGLWSEFARAIDKVRPGLVVIENVRGLLSAAADREMESSPWGLGDRRDGPALRALGAVLGDLADIGYDARWCGVRAADAGATHGRFRVFVVAYPRDAAHLVSEWGRGLGVEPEGDTGAPRGAGRSAAEDADVAAGSERRIAAPGQTERGRSRADAGRRSGTPAADTAGPRLCGREDSRAGGGDAGEDRCGGVELERGGSERVVSAADSDDAADDGQRTRSGSPLGSSAAADSSCERLGEYAGGSPSEEAGQASGHVAAGAGGSRPNQEWGPYRPAIERWEHVTGRVAPAATRADGKGGQPRLSPLFVEWMMGLPEGHVTDVGLKRNAQLKALGNGVVPQQAALAIRALLEQS